MDNAIKPQFPSPGALPSVGEMQTDLYGDTRRGNPGLISRMGVVEKGIDRLEDLEKQGKAFLLGLAVNLLLTLVALAKLFGAI